MPFVVYLSLGHECLRLTMLVLPIPVSSEDQFCADIRTIERAIGNDALRDQAITCEREFVGERGGLARAPSEFGDTIR